MVVVQDAFKLKRKDKKKHPEPSCVFSAGLSKGGCPEEAFQESHAAQNVLLGKLQMIFFCYLLVIRPNPRIPHANTLVNDPTLP